MYDRKRLQRLFANLKTPLIARIPQAVMLFAVFKSNLLSGQRATFFWLSLQDQIWYKRLKRLFYNTIHTFKLIK